MDKMDTQKCSICDLASGAYDEKLYLYRCEVCRHIFTKLPPAMQESYEAVYFEEGHQNWFENPNFKLFEDIERQINNIENVNLLDVGSGQGDFLIWLEGRRPDYGLTGIDLAPVSHDRIKFITGDIFEIDLNEKFNVITSFMMVEHLEEIKPFFQKMRSILDDDGIFVVNTFNIDSMIFRMAMFLRSIGIRVAFDRLFSRHHLQHYSKNSIRKILTLSGFDIVEHRCNNYPLKAVDVPEAAPIIEMMYKAAVGSIFLLSEPIGMGIEHTIFCKPSARQSSQ
jgi:2-polyprenyl-3-methyl-5-hydroxy-6-metoxy-1,4-benzoquinol methylase